MIFVSEFLILHFHLTLNWLLLSAHQHLPQLAY